MKLRSILSVAVLFSELLVPHGDALADTVEVPAPMQYYLTDIEAPFAGVAAVIEIYEVCDAKFTAGCGDVDAAVIETMRGATKLLGAVSLFAIPLHRYRAEQFSSSHELARAWESQKRPFVTELKKFDMKFIGRFEATADVCPSANQKSYAIILAQLVLHRFWRMQGSELDEAIAEIDSTRREYAAKLRDNFSPDACVKIRKQGFLLTEVYKIRFKTYGLDKDGWQPLTLKQQFVGGVTFLWDFVVKMEADIGDQRFVEYLAKH